MQEKIAVVGGGSTRKRTLAWIAEHSSELKKTDALIAFEQEVGMEVPVDIEGHLINNPKDTDTPRTIESLRVWADVMKLPLDRMNICIGEDCPVSKGKKYGVYKDGDDFIVYKNHNDKEHRDIRYQGPDESVAVGMLYERMVYWL